MTQKAIVLTFALGMSVYVAAVFLWPFGSAMPDKGNRLAGQGEQTAFLPERFGVPASPELVTPG